MPAFRAGTLPKGPGLAPQARAGARLIPVIPLHPPLKRCPPSIELIRPRHGLRAIQSEGNAHRCYSAVRFSKTNVPVVLGRF